MILNGNAYSKAFKLAYLFNYNMEEKLRKARKKRILNMNHPDFGRTKISKKDYETLSDEAKEKYRKIRKEINDGNKERKTEYAPKFYDH